MSKNVASDLYCTFCGSYMVIRREKGERRERYHIKDFYCHHCDHVRPFIEIRDKDYISDRRMGRIRYGILPYYFERYGLDFLKFLLYVPCISNYNDFRQFSRIINSKLNMELLFEDYKVLTRIVKSLKSRDPQTWQKMMKLLEQKAICIDVRNLK